MVRSLFYLSLVAISSVFFLISCSTPAAPAAIAPSATPAAATSPTSAKEPTIDDIFPPGKERDIVLNNCTSCHNYGCVVRGQKAVAHWQQIKTGHRDRVPSVSDADYNAALAYLAANFNDAKPEPRLPQVIAEAGCPTQ